MERTTYQVSGADTRKLAVRALTVLGIVGIANLIVWWAFHPIPTSSFPIRAYKFWHLEQSPDLVFIGSSASRENIDVDQVSDMLASAGAPVSTFNLGITGGGPHVEREILKGLALKRMGRGDFGAPKLWIFEYHPLELAPNFTSKGGIAQIDEVSSWTDRYDKLDSLPEFAWDTFKHGMGVYQRAAFDNLTYDASEWMPLLKLGRDWPTKDRVRRIVRTGLASVGVGSKPSLIPDLPLLYLKETVEQYRVTDTASQAIREMIDLVQQAGGRIIIISFPFSQASNMPASVVEQFQGVVRGMAEPRGVPYYPLTLEDCGLQDEDFFDFIHVTRPARGKSTTCVVEKALKQHVLSKR